MAKKSRTNGAAKPKGNGADTGADVEHAKAQINSLIGSLMSNVSDERMQQFQRDWNAQKAVVKAEKDALDDIEEKAEGDGIDVPLFKFIEKLKAKMAPEARSKLQKVLQYSRQLGLLDLIEAHEQDEAREANAASVAAAEHGAGKTKVAKVTPNKNTGDAQPVTGCTVEAAKAQGFQAGLDGDTSLVNPYKPSQADLRKAWSEGHNDGCIERLSPSKGEQSAEAATA